MKVYTDLAYTEYDITPMVEMSYQNERPCKGKEPADFYQISGKVKGIGEIVPIATTSTYQEALNLVRACEKILAKHGQLTNTYKEISHENS